MADAGRSNVILRFIPIPPRALLYIVLNDGSHTWTDRSQVFLQHPPVANVHLADCVQFPSRSLGDFPTTAPTETQSISLS